MLTKLKLGQLIFIALESNTVSLEGRLYLYMSLIHTNGVDFFLLCFCQCVTFVKKKDGMTVLGTSKMLMFCLLTGYLSKIFSLST